MAGGLELAPLNFQLRCDTAVFINQMNLASNSMHQIEGQVEETSQSVESKFTELGNKLITIGGILTSSITTPLLSLGKGSITVASDFKESMRTINNTFGENSSKIEQWSDTTFDKFGLAKETAIEMAADFGDMGISMSVTTDKAMDMSMQMSELAGDLASCNNISIERAQSALSGVYSGETKELEKLGIVMSENNLQAFAETQGIKKKIKGMSDAELVQLRYNYVMEKTKDIQGDYAKNTDSTSNSTRSFKESMKDLQLTIGEKLLPVITPLIKKITDLVRWFTELNPGIQSLIVNFGVFIATLGPIISIVGKGIGIFTALAPALNLTSAATTGAGVAAGGAAIGVGSLSTVLVPLIAIIGTVAGGIYLFTKNTELMSGSCLNSSEDLGVVGNALEMLHGDYALTTDEMDKMNIKHKEWSDKISPETQKALTETSDKIAKLNYELESTNGLDGVITQTQIDGLKKRTDDLFNETVEKIKQRAPETQKAMAEAFKADDGKLDENEQKLEEFFNQSQNKQIDEVKGYQKQINDIYANAAKENRDLKQEEVKTIQDLTIKMGNVNLSNTVKNNQELIAAQADFNARIKNLDMNGLSSLLSEKAKARDKELASIRQNYDKQIEELKLYRPQMNDEQQKACDDQIAKLEKLKTDSLSKEKDKYQGFLNEAIKKYPQLIDYINTSNGEIMTDEEQNNFKRLRKYANHMDGMMGITKTGYYQIKDSVDGSMHDCYVEVDEASGQIVGSWDRSTGEIYGNPIKAREDINQDLKNGVAFKPITDSYDEEKQKVWINAIKVQCSQDWDLFGWIKTKWNNTIGYIVKHPIQAATNFFGGGTPSHAYNGLDYVPYDGYLTRLHKGERVMTADENKKYSNNNTTSTVVNFNGTYGFKDRADIDYFMNQAAIKLKGIR